MTKTTGVPESCRVNFDYIRKQPHLWKIAADILWLSGHAADQQDFLSQTIPAILAQSGGDYAAIAAPIAGRWTILAQCGAEHALPLELLADVLDTRIAKCRGNWIAVLLEAAGSPSDVLAVHCANIAETEKASALLENIAPLVGDALALVRQRQQDIRRLRRMEAILEISNQWNQTREVEPLLVQMAEAATRLLSADRASIFLWDRTNHLLVGRPALGLPGGELRIPDDRGVVGQVIQSGEPRRVDAAVQPHEVDRNVDAQLHYKTRTLLCVPLRGRSGELFGAFELINKHSGAFTTEDETALR
ncbi:MAG: GAF domain-containing protein, partial [Thermoguttaceae bacterium]